MKIFAWVKFVLFVIFVVVLDQYTKLLIVANFAEGDVRTVLDGFFNLTLTYNPGVAFGVMRQMDPSIRQIVLAVTTSVAMIFVFYLLLKDYRSDGIAQFALAFIVGGAIGNVFDRIRIGHVVDFLQFYVKDYYWPSFNLADSAVFLGVAIILLKSLKPARKGLA